MERMIFAVLAATFSFTGQPVQAQASGGDPAVQDALKAMQQEIDKLRTENQKMHGEIDDLRARSGGEDNWLTEARAEQIRGLVQDVLADADTRASLLNDGLQAGWSDHFFLASPDGRSNLTLEGLMQIRWIFNYHDVPDRNRSGFENTRDWLTFRGHVFTPDLQYLVRGDFARSGGNETLLDAWIRYNLTDEWSIRFGQFKLPFMREELIYDGYQQAVERSVGDQSMSLMRSQGVELTYGGDFDRVSVATSDGGSAVLGGLGTSAGGNSHINTPALNEDVEWAVTARYEHLFAGNWEQFTDFTSPRGEEFGLMAGLAVHAQRTEANGMFNPFMPQHNTQWFGYTADDSAEFGGANLFAAWTHHYVDTPSIIVNFYSLVVQGGLYLTPKWEVFTRGEYNFVAGKNLMFEDLPIVTLGTNYYFEGHDVKWTTDIGFAINRVESIWVSDLAGYRMDPAGTSAEPQVVFRTQFQLLF